MQPVAPIASTTYIPGSPSDTTQGRSVSRLKENKIEETLRAEGEASTTHLKPFPNVTSGSSQPMRGEAPTKDSLPDKLTTSIDGGEKELDEALREAQKELEELLNWKDKAPLFKLYSLSDEQKQAIDQNIRNANDLIGRVLKVHSSKQNSAEQAILSESKECTTREKALSRFFGEWKAFNKGIIKWIERPLKAKLLNPLSTQKGKEKAISLKEVNEEERTLLEELKSFNRDILNLVQNIDKYLEKNPLTEFKKLKWIATAITALGVATTGVMIYREIIKSTAGVVTVATTLATWAMNAFLIPILELKEQYKTEDIQTVRDTIYSSTLMQNLHERIDIMDVSLRKIDSHITNMDLNLNKKLDANIEGIAKRDKELAKEIAERDRKHETEIAERDRKYETDIAERDRKYETDIAERDRKYETDIAASNNKREIDIASLTVRFNARIAELEDKILARLPNIPASTNGA